MGNDHTVRIKLSLSADAAKNQQAVQSAKSAIDQVYGHQQKEAARAAREVERINQATTRQANHEELVRARAAKSLADEKMRVIKREQDAFLRAEAEKTAAARAAAAAQARAMESTKATMMAAWGIIKASALVVFAGIVAAATGLGLAIHRAMSFDVLERGLEIVAGTSEEAAKQLARLKELARLPGLGLRQAIEASIALQIGFQTAIKDTSSRVALAEEVIKQFSNAIALTGGGPEVFQRVITQLTQMSNAGKVLMTDLRPIIQAAPALGQSLLKAFGTISPEEINALGLSSEEFIRRWVAALAELKRAPDTAANAWTNFTVAFDMALVKIGKPFLEPLTRALNTLEPLLDSLSTRVSALFAMMGQDASNLWANLPATTRAAFSDMLATVQGLGGQVTGWFKENYPLMQQVVINALNQIAAFWNSHGTEIKTVAGNVLKDIGDTARIALNILSGDWKTAWNKLGELIRDEGPRMKAAAEFVVRLAFDALLAQKDLLKKAGVSLGEALVDGVSGGILRKAAGLAETVADTFTRIPSLVRKLWDIKSPSRVFQRIGEQAVEGLRLGLQSGQAVIRESIADLTDLARLGFTTRERKVGNKPQEDAAKQIADELSRQSQAIRSLAGKDSEVDRINKLLGDPSVARIIDERTGAILRQNAAIEDSLTAAEGKTRGRYATQSLVRDRQVNPPDPVEREVSQFYASIIEDLNGKIERNIELTQVQLVLQRLEAAGLTDLSNAHAQEALAIAATIDQQTALNESRSQLAGWANDVSSIFGRAVESWDGTFKGFFRSIRDGFVDLFRRSIAEVVQSNIFNGLRNLLSSIFLPKGGGGGLFSFGGGGSSSGGGGFSFANFAPLALGFAGAGGAAIPGSTVTGGGANFSLDNLFRSMGNPFDSFVNGGGPTITSWSQSAGSANGATGVLQGTVSNAATQGGFNLNRIGESLAMMAPLIGAGLGARLGGESRVGQAIGAIGGGVFGLGALLGGGLAGLFTNPFTAPIGIALLLGSFFIGRNSRRRSEETQRDAAIVDAFTQLDRIKRLIESHRLDGAQGLEQAMDIRAQYVSAMSQLKDRKTRDHALQDVSRIDGKIALIRAAANTALNESNVERRLVPEFAIGGIMPGKYGQPGLAVLHGGEVILNAGHVASVGASTLAQAGVPGFHGRTGDSERNINVEVQLGTQTQDRILIDGMERPRVRRNMARNVNDMIKKHEIDPNTR